MTPKLKVKIIAVLPLVFSLLATLGEGISVIIPEK